MRVVFTCVPQTGHLTPLLPLAEAFHEGGDEIVFATGDDARAAVTGRGLGFRRAGPSFGEWYASLRARTRGVPGDAAPWDGADRVVSRPPRLPRRQGCSRSCVASGTPDRPPASGRGGRAGRSLGGARRRRDRRRPGSARRASRRVALTTGDEAVHLAAADRVRDPDLVVVAGDDALLAATTAVGMAGCRRRPILLFDVGDMGEGALLRGVPPPTSPHLSETG